MKKTILLIISTIFLFVLLFALASTIITDYNVSENVDSLQNINDDNEVDKFDYDEIKGLPVPVQKYFRLNIEHGSYKPKSVRIRQKSRIKMEEDSEWKNLEAEQYYLTRSPGYVWNGSIKTSEFIWIRVIESYIDGEAKIIFKLLSALNMGEHFGNELNTSALARYLMESVYFPSMLLPSKYISWKPVNSMSAIVTLTYKELSVSAICTFNNLGEIIKIESNDRYKATKTGIHKTTFITHHSKYRTYMGLSIPTFSKVQIVLGDSTLDYREIELLDVNYNNLGIFEIRNK